MKSFLKHALTLPDQLSRSLSRSGFSGTAGDSAMFASEMAAIVANSHHMHSPVFSTSSHRGPMGLLVPSMFVLRRA
jgi:hypothetical protein